MQDLDNTSEALLGLVVIARAKHLVPSRTQPLSAAAPMVLRLKTWESRSPPNLAKPLRQSYLSAMRLKPNRFNRPQKRDNATWPNVTQNVTGNTTGPKKRNAQMAISVAGWSSPVARQAHNLKVVGSNPTPATKNINNHNALRPAFRGAFCCLACCRFHGRQFKLS